jgi:hypothetical protein
VRPSRDLARLVILALPIVLALPGCGGTAASGSAAASPSLANRASATSTAPSVSATAVVRPSSAPPGLAVDARLLEVLPTEVDGVALEADPTTAAQVAANPFLAFYVEAIAVALAISPATSSETDLAVVSVLRLRPGTFSDAWFTIYRQGFDAAACEAGGGVDGQPSETTIGGRTTYVGTCAENAHTYHVHLADRNVVVSILAAGPGSFGKLVVAGLSE